MFSQNLGNEGQSSLLWDTLSMIVNRVRLKAIWQSEAYQKFISLCVIIPSIVGFAYGLFVNSPILMVFSFGLSIGVAFKNQISSYMHRAYAFTLSNSEKIALSIIVLAMFSKIYEKLAPQEKKESKQTIKSKIFDVFDLIFTLMLVPMAYRLGVHRCQQVFQKSAGYLAMVMAAVNSILIIKRTFFSGGSGVIDEAVKESTAQVNVIESRMASLGSVLGVENKTAEVREEALPFRGPEDEDRAISNWLGLRALWGAPARPASDRRGVGYRSEREIHEELRLQREGAQEYSIFRSLAGKNLPLAIAAIVVITTFSIVLVNRWRDTKIKLNTEGKGARKARAARRGKEKRKLYTQSGGEVKDPEYDQPMFIKEYDEDTKKFIYIPWEGKKTYSATQDDDEGWYAVFDDPEYYRGKQFDELYATSKHEAMIAGKKGFKIGIVERAVGYCYTEGHKMCCTLIQGSVVTCAHIFDGCENSPIRFIFGSDSFECRKAQGVSVGSDLLAFPVPSGKGMKSLKLAQAKQEQDCAVVTYHSEADQRNGHAHVTFGVVRDVTDKLFHTCTTGLGVCGSPIVNSEGKVLAIHNSTTGSGHSVINMGQFVAPDVEQLMLKHKRIAKEGFDKCVTPNCDGSCGKFHEVNRKSPFVRRPGPCYAMKFNGECQRPNCKFSHFCHRWCQDEKCKLKHVPMEKKEDEKNYPSSLNLQAPTQM